MVNLRFLFRAQKARWRDQRREIKAVLAELRGGDLAVDVGANKGAYLFWLRRAVGPAGKVIAFEPQPVLADYLKSICLARRWTNVSIRACALSDSAGVGRLQVPSAGVSPGASLSAPADSSEPSHSYECRTDTLDAQLRSERSVSLVKADVEGHELQVFRGGEQTLRSQRPALLFECEARHLSRHGMGDVFAYLTDLGYRGFFFSPRGLRDLAEFNPRTHQAPQPGRYWDAPGYCNNFLFKADRRH